MKSRIIRRTRYPLLLGITLVLIRVAAVAQLRQPDILLCKTTNIPLLLPQQDFPGSIRNHVFSAFRIKDSSGGVTFQSGLRHPIIGIAAVIDYLNEQNEVVVQIPYLAVTAKAKKYFHPLVHPEYVNTLKKSIPPGGSTRLGSESFVILTRCPVKARMSMVTVMYSDLSTQTWASSHWRLEPALKDFPRYLNLPPFLVEPPLELLLNVEINAQGRVSAIKALNGQTPELLEYLLAELKKWVFFPALDQGKPTNANLIFLFRFETAESRDRRDYGSVKPEQVPIPLTVVDLLPLSPTGQQWDLWYGRRPGDTQLN